MAGDHRVTDSYDREMCREPERSSSGAVKGGTRRSGGLDDGCTTDVPAGLPLVLGDEHCLVRSITSPSCAPLRTIYAREVQEIQSANEVFGETSPLLVDSCVISPTEISAQCEVSLNLNHNIVLILQKDLPSISPDKILYSVMLNEPISLHCAMNKISEIAYINTSTYAYGFIFNLIGDYSMHDNFRVNQICVTCDRIAELKIDSITHICNLSHDVCYEPLHEFRNSRVHYELIEVVHSSSTASHVWNCFDVASSNSDWFYMLCMFHAWMFTCDNWCFTYISNLSCFIHVGYIHANESNLYIGYLHDLYHLCWVDLIPVLVVKLN